MSVSTTLLQDLGRVQALFPPGFNAVVECLKAGIEKIELASTGVFSKSPGMYCAEEKVIRLDPGLSDHEKAQLARGISRRNGLTVRAADLFVWVFFHEAGHHVRRRNLLSLDRRNSLLGPLWPAEAESVAWEESEAEAYAKKCFIAWKGSRK